MTKTDSKVRKNIWTDMTPEQRSAHARWMVSRRKHNPGGFKVGSDLPALAGRKGGVASGETRRRKREAKQEEQAHDA